METHARYLTWEGDDTKTHEKHCKTRLQAQNNVEKKSNENKKGEGGELRERHVTWSHNQRNGQ